MTQNSPCKCSLVVCGTPEVKAKWMDSGDLERVLTEHLKDPFHPQFQLLPTGGSDKPGSTKATPAARFLQAFAPTLDTAALSDETHPPEEMIVDLTYGFRSQTLLATTAIAAATEEAARAKESPAIRMVCGAHESRVDGVASIWDITGMLTQQSWVRAIDGLVSNARADDVEALCLQLAYTRVRLDTTDRNRRAEAKTLKALGRAARTLADDITCARIPHVLTKSAVEFLQRLDTASGRIREHSPLTARPLDTLAEQVTRLQAPLPVSPRGLHAQVALTQLCLKTQRHAAATGILRELLVCAWHLELVVGEAWQPGKPSGDLKWETVSKDILSDHFCPPPHTDAARLEEIRKQYQSVVDLRNDVQHGGMRTCPLTADKVRQACDRETGLCERLVARLHPETT